MHVLQQKVSTYFVEAKNEYSSLQKRRNEYVLLQKHEEMSTIVEVQDHKEFPRSKPRNKQGNDEEKDAHIIIIDNPFE